MMFRGIWSISAQFSLGLSSLNVKKHDVDYRICRSQFSLMSPFAVVSDCTLRTCFFSKARSGIMLMRMCFAVWLFPVAKNFLARTLKDDYIWGIEKVGEGFDCYASIFFFCSGQT